MGSHPAFLFQDERCSLPRLCGPVGIAALFGQLSQRTPGTRSQFRVLQACCRLGQQLLSFAPQLAIHAGLACQVLQARVAGMALLREFEQDARLTVHQLIAELYDGVDWVLVEGFKDSDLQKVEVWRADSGQRARYPDDDFIVAIATDSPDLLPEPTQREVMDLNNPDAVADWLIASQLRFEYNSELYQ